MECTRTYKSYIDHIKLNHYHSQQIAAYVMDSYSFCLNACFDHRALIPFHLQLVLYELLSMSICLTWNSGVTTENLHELSTIV